MNFTIRKYKYLDWPAYLLLKKKLVLSLLLHVTKEAEHFYQ